MSTNIKEMLSQITEAELGELWKAIDAELKARWKANILRQEGDTPSEPVYHWEHRAMLYRGGATASQRCPCEICRAAESRLEAEGKQAVETLQKLEGK